MFGFDKCFAGGFWNLLTLSTWDGFWGNCFVTGCLLGFRAVFMWLELTEFS